MKALIVVDMQWGIFNKATKVFECERLISNINQLIDHFHKLNLPVIFLRFTGAYVLMKQTKDWELLPEIHFIKEDYVIDKLRSDAFCEIQFIKTLESLGTDHIYITGVISHGCVQSTVYGAINHKMPVTLISDAHSNFSNNPAFVIESVNYRIYNDHVELLSTAEAIQRIK